MVHAVYRLDDMKFLIDYPIHQTLCYRYNICYDVLLLELFIQTNTVVQQFLLYMCVRGCVCSACAYMYFCVLFVQSMCTFVCVSIEVCSVCGVYILGVRVGVHLGCVCVWGGGELEKYYTH